MRFIDSVFDLLFFLQRIVKMNKTEDDEMGDEELTDEEIRALSDGLSSYNSCQLVFLRMNGNKTLMG